MKPEIVTGIMALLTVDARKMPKKQTTNKIPQPTAEVWRSAQGTRPPPLHCPNSTQKEGADTA